MDTKAVDRLLEYLAELIEIPSSHYRKAKGRYESVGEWLNRSDGGVAKYSPEVFSQGSFRYGTVIRPLNEREEYDLDLVCELTMDKGAITQEAVKNLVGGEIRKYAEAYSFKEPAEEKVRCWRLNYADDVSFHMDILPCIPDSGRSVARLLELGIARRITDTTVAITDKRHPKYQEISFDWFNSNPRGFAVWFEERMKPAALPHLKQLVEDRVFASIDDVPTFEWKTPLQQAIQVLKRHRDVTFSSNPKLKPISMILTTLSAQAYNGETNLYEALMNIVNKMPNYVRANKPRIPNPVDPAEDFADKWFKDSQLETNFWVWHSAIKADLEKLSRVVDPAETSRLFEEAFGIKSSSDIEKRIASFHDRTTSVTFTPKPVTRIVEAPKPWRRGS